MHVLPQSLFLRNDDSFLELESSMIIELAVNFVTSSSSFNFYPPCRPLLHHIPFLLQTLASVFATASQLILKYCLQQKINGAIERAFQQSPSFVIQNCFDLSEFYADQFFHA